MKASIRKEFKMRAIDYVNDGLLTNDNKEQWHDYLFNEDQYIIYHYKAEQWLKRHEVSPFEAIGIVQEYQEDNFGETFFHPSSAESVVNNLISVLGEEWMREEGEEFIQNYIH